MKSKVTRRQLMKGAIGTLVIANATHLPRAWAADRLKEDDPTAIALGYKEDAETVDANTEPTFKPGQTCGNCLQYQGTVETEDGGCAIFPGKNVLAKGWCKVWAAK